jgi:hypothetical protein
MRGKNPKCSKVGSFQCNIVGRKTGKLKQIQSSKKKEKENPIFYLGHRRQLGCCSAKRHH